MLQLVMGEPRSLSAVGSLSILDLEEGRRYEGKEDEGALFQMQWVDQPIHSAVLWSGGVGSRAWRYGT